MESVTEPPVSVSVLIPVKDRLGSLREAVASVLRQSSRPAEIIIVDDGSALPVVSSVETIDGIRIRVLTNPVNIGGAASYNRALGEATGDIVAFLDSDDYWGSEYLREVVALWSSMDASNAGVATGLYWCTDSLTPYRTQIAAPRVTYADLIRNGNCVGGNSVISVRRSQFLAVGGFPKIRASYDWGGLLRIATLGDIAVVQKPLVFYRSPSSSALSNYTRSYRRQILAKAELTRMMPEADRRALRRLFRDYAAFALANTKHRRMSRRLLLSAIRNDRKLTGLTLRALILNLVGNRTYTALLRQLARLRTRRFKGPIDGSPLAAEDSAAADFLAERDPTGPGNG